MFNQPTRYMVRGEYYATGSLSRAFPDYDAAVTWLQNHGQMFRQAHIVKVWTGESGALRFLTLDTVGTV